MAAPPQRLDSLTDDDAVTIADVGETKFAGGIGSLVIDRVCEAAGC